MSKGGGAAANTGNTGNTGGSAENFFRLHLFSRATGVPHTDITLTACYVCSASGVVPAEIGIERLNNSASTPGVSAFITASTLSEPVTLRASGPCH